MINIHTLLLHNWIDLFSITGGLLFWWLRIFRGGGQGRAGCVTKEWLPHMYDVSHPFSSEIGRLPEHVVWSAPLLWKWSRITITFRTSTTDQTKLFTSFYCSYQHVRKTKQRRLWRIRVTSSARLDNQTKTSLMFEGGMRATSSIYVWKTNKDVFNVLWPRLRHVWTTNQRRISM